MGIRPAVPFAAVCIFVVLANLRSIFVRLALPYPVSPWEAGIVTDAWRLLQGEGVYTPGTDHATHMYGPFTSGLLAAIFHFTGPWLQAGRYLSAACGAATVVMLTKALAPRTTAWVWLSAAAVLLAANGRTQNYFTESRPDLLAIFFATAGLLLVFRGVENSASLRYGHAVAGSLLLTVALLFKQTAIVFAAIPPLALLFHDLPLRRRGLIRLAAAAMPLAAAIAVMAGIWRLAPGLWHFMIQVPAQYRVPPQRVARMGEELLLSLPFFLLAFTHWLWTDAASTWREPRARWLMAALFVTMPVSVVAMAKDGGAQNSLLPALLAAGAFCVWRAPGFFARSAAADGPWAIRALAWTALAVVLFAQSFPVPQALASASTRGGHGVAGRLQVIAEARALPGKVVSPDDPTIALEAKGYAGRTAVFEADAVYWDFARMQAVRKEIAAASYVIVMQPGALPGGNAMVTTQVGVGLTPDLLREAGFEKIAFQRTSSPVYALWRRR